MTGAASGREANDGGLSDGTPGFDDIVAAARRLAGAARVTPLLEADSLNRLAGRRILLKAENLQHTGSFKFRGAYNRIVQLGAEERQAGVVAWSSGNHAQGVAAAARRCGVNAKIVMPKDAPLIKRQRTLDDGAEVVLVGPDSAEREAVGREIAAREGRTVVPPYDHAHVVAGQGTVGNEIADQCLAQGIKPDAVLIPCSGGGLAAGSAIALRRKLPDADIFSVEPAGYDDTARSLAAGRRIANQTQPPTLCDALLVAQPGELTFPLNRRLLTGGLAVNDAAVADAMRAAFAMLKIVLEPGGAAALAAALSAGLPADYRTVAVVASGGNVEPTLFARIMDESMTPGS